LRGRRLNRKQEGPGAVGEQANRRLRDAQAADAQPAPDVVTLDQVSRRRTSGDGQRTPGYASPTPWLTAHLSAIVGFGRLDVHHTIQRPPTT
jgi:hypothetical protein